MVQLSRDPRDWELEDLVAAHFVSRGCFVESGVTERSPAEILELDVVWTDYRHTTAVPSPVEVKSGDWSLPELFKFFGWTRYLGQPPGHLAYRREAKDLKLVEKVCARSGIQLLRVSTPEEVDAGFKSLGLPDPPAEYLPDLWRFSYWARRRLFDALQQAIQLGVCPQSAVKAKEYRRLINDALFFEPDPRDRFARLVAAHWDHPSLAASAAAETEGGTPDFKEPPRTATYTRALYAGAHLPVQACFYLAHSAQLYVLKAAVDLWLAREAGTLQKLVVRIGDQEFDLGEASLSLSFSSGIRRYSKSSWFPLLPVFWQVFLWGWGGFLLKDRLEEEYTLLSQQTGIPVDQVPEALAAFDVFFPIDQGWFRTPSADSRRVLQQMPAAMRGLGANLRLVIAKVDKYTELGFADATTDRLGQDHQAIFRLLDCPKADLVK